MSRPGVHKITPPFNFGQFLLCVAPPSFSFVFAAVSVILKLAELSLTIKLDYKQINKQK